MPSLMISTNEWLRKSRQLAEVSRSLTYAMGVDELMQFSVSQAASLLDTEKAVLLTSDSDGLLVVRASVGIASELTSNFELPLMESFSPHFESLFGISEEFFLGVPLVVGGQISGILAIAREASSLTLEAQEFLLSALADQVAVAIEQVQLGEAAKFRERLIGIVSHDLRTPISAISFVAQSILRKKSADASVTAGVLRIQRSAERASRMIRDLLDYTQFHLGSGIQLQYRLLRTADVVDHCVDEINQVHPSRQIKILHKGKSQGQWDGDRLEQALGNILTNALAYSPNDSIIHVCTWQENATAFISVHNAGEPIVPKRLPHIFEPMQRGTSTSNSARSVGLGLYIVKNIIDAHRGRIDVHSSLVSGTTVTLQLPCEVANP